VPFPLLLFIARDIGQPLSASAASAASVQFVEGIARTQQVNTVLTIFFFYLAIANIFDALQ